MFIQSHEKLIQTLSQPAILIDNDLTIVRANRSFLKFLAIKPEQLTGLKITNFVTESQWIHLKNLNNLPESSTFVIHNRSNQKIICNQFSLPIEKNKFYLFLSDENSHDDLKTQDNTLEVIKELAELMPGNFYWKDVYGVYLGCNSLLLKTLNLSSKNDIVGKTDQDLWPEQANELRRNDLYVMETGKPLEREEVALLADGTKGYFAAIKVPLKNSSGDVIGIIGNSLDITAEKRKLEIEQENLKLDQEKRKAEAKAQTQEEIQRAILTFTGTMSHDLRTPLSTIVVVTGLLSKVLPLLIEAYKNQEAQEAAKSGDEYHHQISVKQLKTISESCQTIGEVVKQAESYIDVTLKILRGAASGSELLKPEDLVPCSIEEIARRVVRMFPYQNNEEEKVHLDTLRSFNFMGNSIFMARILQNLIKNSFEQIRAKGQGEIVIWCEEGVEKNSLHIKDTAGEVTQTVIDHLFDGFNSTKKSGTGIGLSSAKQIMQAFGGDITCKLVDQDYIEFVMEFPTLKTHEQDTI